MSQIIPNTAIWNYNRDKAVWDFWKILQIRLHIPMNANFQNNLPILVIMTYWHLQSLLCLPWVLWRHHVNNIMRLPTALSCPFRWSTASFECVLNMNLYMSQLHWGPSKSCSGYRNTYFKIIFQNIFHQLICLDWENHISTYSILNGISCCSILSVWQICLYPSMWDQMLGL